MPGRRPSTLGNPPAGAGQEFSSLPGLQVKQTFLLFIPLGKHLRKKIHKLQLVQNFVARIILGFRKYDHISAGLRQLLWLPVKDSIMTFKCFNGLASD